MHPLWVEKYFLAMPRYREQLLILALKKSLKMFQLIIKLLLNEGL